MISATIQMINNMIDGKLFINNGSMEDQVNGVSIDSRKIEKNNIYIAIAGNKVDGHSFLETVYKQGASLAIVDNPKYVNRSIPTILVSDSVTALQQLAKVYRESLKVKVIGITGSNGKTSCKDLLASILASKYEVIKTHGNQNNEIGVPLTLLRMSESTQFAIVEMGMENFGDIHFLNDIVKMDMGVVTNVGIAHLENLGSIDNIGRAKLEIIDGLKDHSLFVYKGDDEVLKRMIKEKDISPLRVRTFGFEMGNDLYLKSFEQDGNKIIFQFNTSDHKFVINTLGKHQALNAMAAILCAYDIGMDDVSIQKGLSAYESTGMRNELMQIEQMIILNDAYKSNPQSAKVAIDTFETIVAPYKIVVLADMLDLGRDTIQFHFELGSYLAGKTYDELITYGPLSKYIYEGTLHKNSDKKYHHMDTHEAVVTYLKPFLKKDCAVLFKGSRGMELDKIIDGLLGE